ncbi:MAG: glycosyltransferase [bacterium]
MRVLLLAAASDIHSVRWANQLSANGNEVHLCYMSNQKPAMDQFKNSVYLHELKFGAPYGYYLNVLQLKRIIWGVKPDILNAHYSSGYGTLARLTGFSPYLLSVYGSDVYDFPYRNKINMRIIKKNLLAADGVASTSNVMAQQIKRLVDFPLENIFITPFGVDIDKFKKTDVDKNKDEFIIGSIKKLSPKYGMKYGILAVDYLIKSLIKENSITIKYYIYGEGEERENLFKLVKERQLEDVVEFKGRIPNNEVPRALNKFDVFLGNSILDSESFGVAIVEAMACEVPVIVTDVDGFKEVVDGGKAGIMVPRKNSEIMAKEVYKLVKNPGLRKKIGMKQRDRVVKNYNWSDNVKKMESIYKIIFENQSLGRFQ